MLTGFYLLTWDVIFIMVLTSLKPYHLELLMLEITQRPVESTQHPGPVPKIPTQSETWKPIYLDDETDNKLIGDSGHVI